MAQVWEDLLGDGLGVEEGLVELGIETGELVGRLIATMLESTGLDAGATADDEGMLDVRVVVCKVRIDEDGSAQIPYRGSHPLRELQYDSVLPHLLYAQQFPNFELIQVMALEPPQMPS